MSVQCGELCGAFIDVGVFAALMVVGVSFLVSGVFDMIRAWRKRSALPTTDQKCPHCGTWQSDCGGWQWVGNSENHEIDFVAICGECRMESRWVWVGPSTCATYEEINKPKRKPAPPRFL